MVKLNKSHLQKGVYIRSEDDYRKDPVFSLMKNDCHNKCYICEEKEPTGLQVEHLVAPKGSNRLKYGWENLLLACYHCNRTKRDRFNNIIDCTKVDPESYIAVSMIPALKEQVRIDVLQYSEKAKETAALLELIYNGEKTVILSSECENLRNRIIKELNDFRQKLDLYEDEPDTLVKYGFYQSVVRMIERSSAFSAFKRGIIRRNTAYMCEFGGHLA